VRFSERKPGLTEEFKSAGVNNGRDKNAGGFTPGAGTYRGGHFDFGTSGARPWPAPWPSARLDGSDQATRPSARKQEQSQGKPSGVESRLHRVRARYTGR